MIVEVIVSCTSTYRPWFGKVQTFDSVSCIQGCCLSRGLKGKKRGMLGPKRLNEVYIQAVMCTNCLGIRHLNLFKEIEI